MLAWGGVDRERAKGNQLTESLLILQSCDSDRESGFFLVGGFRFVGCGRSFWFVLVRFKVVVSFL